MTCGRREGARGSAAGRLWLVLPLVAVSCELIVAAAREGGFTSRSVDLGAGSVWLASQWTGPA